VIAATAVSLLFLMQFGLIFGVGQFKLLAALLGIALIRFTRHNPMATARFALIWIPLSPVLLSLSLKYGMPSQLVQSGTYIRSGVMIALAMAGWSRRRVDGRPLDAIDRLALAYFALVAVYFVAGPFIETSTLTVTTRLQGVQSVGTFVLAFLAIRWLHPTRTERDSLLRWATGMIAFLAVAGLYQRLDQNGFNRIMFDRVDIDIYLRQIAKLSGPAYSDATSYYFVAPPRVAAFALNPFGFADLMLCGIGIGIAGLSRRSSLVDGALIGACAVGIFFSDTRIAIVAMGAMVLVGMIGRGVSELAKVRFVVIAVVAALALMPLIIQSRLVQTDDNATSDDGHGNELIGSMTDIIERPLGGGVGSDGAVSRRSSSHRTTVSGNAVLALGIQIGALGMFIFIALLVAVAVRTRERHRRGPSHDAVLAQVLLIGTLASSMTHNSWQDAASGPFTWLLIAIACVGAADGADGTRERFRASA
jgi:hypothetical protein